MNEIHADVRHSKIRVDAQAFKNLGALSAFCGNLPQAGCLPGFRIVKEFTIWRFERREAAIPRYLNRLAAIRRYLKHLLRSGASRVEVNPPTVVRPARVSVVSG